MRIGLIAPPFIEVPPSRYGGTELFIGNLACELHARGHDVTVYANGDSRLPCGVKWRYEHAEWPLEDTAAPQLKNADHTAWAVHDAARSVDVLHINDVVGVPFTRFLTMPVVLTIHHPHEPELSRQYERYPDIHYVTIAEWLARRERMPLTSVVHHGIPVERYTYREDKQEYVAFLGRMAPCKGPHLAIEAARLAGVRLKMAGEVQPFFRDYWEQHVRPAIDGDRIQYIGEADWTIKNDLLAHARALLMPIQWEEPFGLVMVESLACGTPVLAFAGGAVDEIVHDGVNGWICRDAADMAAHMVSMDIPADACRQFVRSRFSVARMADDYLRIYERALAGAGASAAELEA
jgi:glycosyltransferase involved in cell wall biosynthesis